jgi:hypothetical protein
MPRRYSKADRKKRAAQMRRLNKRLNADPAFRAAARKRMKRQRIDPTFAALHRAAMQRLHADPFFAAKQLMTHSIPAAKRAAIVAALKAEPNARRVFERVGGASYNTILKFAKEAGIKLPGRCRRAR